MYQLTVIYLDEDKVQWIASANGCVVSYITPKERQLRVTLRNDGGNVGVELRDEDDKPVAWAYRRPL